MEIQKNGKQLSSGEVLPSMTEIQGEGTGCGRIEVPISHLRKDSEILPKPDVDSAVSGQINSYSAVAKGKSSNLDAVSGNCELVQGNKLDFIPDLDKQVCKFTASEVEWQAVLIGGVIGTNVTTAYFLEFAKENWEITCPDISLKANGIWIIKFASLRDRA